MTKEEFDTQRAALLTALGAVAKFAPVENVGFDWHEGNYSLANTLLGVRKDEETRKTP